jgi:effector-binding domain-containing protein
MLDTPHIVHTGAQLTAVIRLRIPRDQIQVVMGPGIQELFSTVAGQGVAITGPWFSHHFRMDPGVFDFEIGVPVGSPVAASGRVMPASLPAQKVVRTIYTGGYEGLGSAWGEFLGLIAAGGHVVADDLVESYLAGPESGPDSSAYRTQLDKPLAE